MANVAFRPGDTLNVVWSSEQDTPLGKRKVESSCTFSYDEILERLQAKGRLLQEKKRSQSSSSRFSRIVALSTHAILHGKWSTGSTIDKTVVLRKLVEHFAELDEAGRASVSKTAKSSLVLLQSSPMLLPEEQQQLQEIILALS